MWLTVVLCLALLIMADYIANLRKSRQMRNIPAVSKIPIIGNMLVLSKFQPDNLHLKFREFISRFGKTFYALLANNLVIVTADPRYIDILLSSQKHIKKHFIYNMLRSWLGNGLLISSGQQWQTMRKIITPTFHFQILEQFVEVFDQQSSILIDKLQPLADGSTVVDIYPLVGLLTMDIIAETAMGVRVDAQVNAKSEFVQAVKDVTNIVATRFVRPFLVFPILFRLTASKQYRKHAEGVATMHKFTATIIEQRRALLEQKIKSAKEGITAEEEEMGIKKRMALLDVLLQSSFENKPLSDVQIRDEVNTFMFEGHDTTTSAISFCLYLISRHATVQRKLFDEVHAHFGDDLHRPITYHDLQQLNYLKNVVKETLRLYPPVPAIGRRIEEDFELKDVTLPATSNVIILLWELLRDPAVFEQPERFWPERHLLHNPRATAYSNIPFSAGPRNCIGQRFALYEMKTVVIKVLRNFELLELGEPVKPSISLVLRSKTGVNIGLKPRGQM